MKNGSEMNSRSLSWSVGIHASPTKSFQPMNFLALAFAQTVLSTLVEDRQKRVFSKLSESVWDKETSLELYKQNQIN